MHRQVGPIFGVVAAATALGMACAADPGDPTKGLSAQTGSTGSGSGSNSGSPIGSSSSGASSGSSSGSNGGNSSSGSSSGPGSSGGNGSSGSTSSGGSGGSSSGPACSTTATSASVQYFTSDAMQTTTKTNQIAFHVAVQNAGFAQLNLSDVTLRYWFSADGNPLSSLVFGCDYAATNGGQNSITAYVMGTFNAAPAATMAPSSDSYLEISFGAAAGSLGFAGAPATVQARLHGDYATNIFNETNDYSFDVTKAQSLVSTTTITAYVKGVLVWGCEPGAGGSGPPSSSSSSSGGVDASPADAAEGGAAAEAGGGG